MILENNIDLNNNFYNNIRSPCTYYTADPFAALKNQVYRSFTSMLVGLEQTSAKFESPFDVIAISETWLESDDCTDIMIEGYEDRNVIEKTGNLVKYIHK